MGGATRSTAGKRTDCQQIAYEDYEFLLTEYEKLPRRTLQFRLFVQRYLKRVTVYPKSVRVPVNARFGSCSPFFVMYPLAFADISCYNEDT